MVMVILHSIIILQRLNILRFVEWNYKKNMRRSYKNTLIICQEKECVCELLIVAQNSYP